MDKNKQLKYGVIVLLLALFVISISFCAYMYSVHSLNEAEFSFDVDKCSNDKNCSFSIYERGGATDSWTKEIKTGSLTESWNGKIYDAKISNLSEYLIDKWSFRININDFCYLNNAWCGLVEIHQFTNGKEAVCKVDLRNIDTEDLKIEYKIEGSDILIPLNKGDYIIYYPNEEVKEVPIKASVNVESEDDCNNSVVGFIFYYPQNSMMDFSDIEFNYSRNMSITKTPVFCVFVIGVFVWFIICIVFAALQISFNVNKKKIQTEQEIIRESIAVFTNIFETKDSYTRGHSQRVAEYTKYIAQKAGYSEEDSNHFSYIALMHDIGKFYIPDEILKKEGKLTQEEYEIVKTHTIKGAQMLKDYKSLDGVVDGVKYHHERYDGKGYPEGLKGKNIPVIGRMICVADSFDAMNSIRCYRGKLDKEYILKELEENKGKQFDAFFVDCLLALIKEGKIVI